MSSDSEDEFPPELRHSTEAVMRAKENNPGMFVSAWQADEEDIAYWSKKDLKKDPKKVFILAGQRGDVETMKDIFETLFGPDWEEKREELLDFLLAADDDGYTALHRAVYSGHLSTAEFLLSHGARIETRTVDGWRPLHSAAFWNQLACVQLLVENGADIGALTDSEQNVLHLALANNQTPETLLYMLAEISAQPELFARLWKQKNKSGDTPQDVLRRSSSLGKYLLDTFSHEAMNLTPSS